MWKCFKVIQGSSSTCLWRWEKELSLAKTCSSVSFFLNWTWIALALTMALGLFAIFVEFVELVGLVVVDTSSWEFERREAVPDEVVEDDDDGNFILVSKSSKWVKEAFNGITDSTGVKCSSLSTKKRKKGHINEII